jgi:peptidoglycan/LPS O-acetylase OafA/YrhL
MGRVKELDGLRAIAIIAVVAWHYLGIGDGPASTPWRVFIVGRSGVDLFFVLSGYLITSILLANSGSGHYFKTFYGRRSLRILPIYFLMVTVYLAGQNIHGDAARYLFSGSVPWWSYVIGLQNIWMAAEQTYGAYWFAGTWSLAIEEQFYLFFPLIVYWVPRRVLPWLLVALLVLCPIGRIMAYSLGDRFGYYVLMPLRADIMAIGSLIAWLEFSEAITASVRRVFRTAFWAAVVFFPVFAWGIDNSDRTSATWGHSYLVVLYGSIVFMVLDHRGAPQLAILRGRGAAFIASISYALYLVHGNVLALFFTAVKADRTILTWQGCALTAAALAASMALCAVSYWLVEAPLIRMAHQKFKFGAVDATSSVAFSRDINFRES